MPKKASSKKKISKKKATTKTKSTKIQKNPNMEKVLIENFISLQKVMTHFATKFDGLSIQISKLLELFEISAKTLAKKDVIINKVPGETKMAEKLDTLLDQNKIIARSLTLLHDSPEPIAQQPRLMQQPMPAQKPTMASQPSPIKQINANGYQRSMSIKKQESPKPKIPR